MNIIPGAIYKTRGDRFFGCVIAELAPEVAYDGKSFYFAVLLRDNIKELLYEREKILRVHERIRQVQKLSDVTKESTHCFYLVKDGRFLQTVAEDHLDFIEEVKL